MCYQATVELFWFCLLLRPFSPPLFLPPPQFPLSATNNKQSHIIYTHKPFVQLLRLEHNKTHENFAWPFYKKWQHRSESAVLAPEKKKKGTVNHLLKNSLVWPFSNWWDWKWGNTKTGFEGMGFMWSCTKFTPKLGGGEAEHREGWVRIMMYQRI